MRLFHKLLAALGVTITMALPITAHLEDCPKNDCAWGAWAILLALTACALVLGLFVQAVEGSDR